MLLILYSKQIKLCINDYLEVWHKDMTISDNRLNIKFILVKNSYIFHH